jgi:predicted deacylase
MHKPASKPAAIHKTTHTQEQKVDMTGRLTGIDFSRTGKQVGYGRVIHSDNIYGGTIIPIPIAVVSSGPGPTVLLVAGTHGDEYEGQILLQELIRSLEPEQVAGTVIIVPSANHAAVLAGTRVSPIDDGNLNRSYPGMPGSGPTSQVAHVISSELLPRADLVIDIHSGGSMSTYLPCAFIYEGPNEALWAQKVAAAQVMGLPYTMVVGSRLEPGSLSTAGDDAGILTLSAELGGGGTVDRAVLAHARRGLTALLKSVGVLIGDNVVNAESGAAIRPVNEPTTWIRLLPESEVTSTAAGLFEPEVDLGQQVTAGQCVGRVHFIEELDRSPREQFATIDGVIAIRRRPTLVRIGTNVVYIAVPFEGP